MTTIMAKKEIKWTEYRVGGGRTVRNSGKLWQERHYTSHYIDGKLSEHIEEMRVILEEHPEATVEMKPLPWEDSQSFVIEWWESIDKNNPLVARALTVKKERADMDAQRKKNELERFRNAFPEHFKP